MGMCTNCSNRVGSNQVNSKERTPIPTATPRSEKRLRHHCEFRLPSPANTRKAQSTTDTAYRGWCRNKDEFLDKGNFDQHERDADGGKIDQETPAQTMLCGCHCGSVATAAARPIKYWSAQPAPAWQPGPGNPTPATAYRHGPARPAIRVGFCSFRKWEKYGWSSLAGRILNL